MQFFAALVVLAYGPLDWSFPAWVWGLSLIAPILVLLLSVLSTALATLTK